MPRVAAVIPARNEAPTVGAVVDAAVGAATVDEVVVVDSCSTDDTGAIATLHGATVRREARPGKGQAMWAGVDATDAEVIVFLDADLVGLRPDHVDSLVAPVLAGEAEMVCGLFDRGPLANLVFLRSLPILTGQRAVRRELFASLRLADIKGYKVEAALNSLVAARGLRRRDFVCDGLWHRTKEEKFPTPVQGFARKSAMLAVAMWSYASYALRRRLLAPAGAARARG